MEKKHTHFVSVILLTPFILLSSCNVSGESFSMKKTKVESYHSVELLHEDNYAYLTTIDNNIYFAFEGNTALKALTKESFMIISDNSDEYMIASKYDYYEDSSFVVYFNLTSYFASQVTSSIHFYPHLYINDELWDGYQYGDLLSSDGEKDYLPQKCYKSEGNHQYYLRPITSSYPMCEIISYLDMDIEVNDDSNYLNIKNDDEHFYVEIDGSYESDVTLVKKSLSLFCPGKGSYDCSSLELNETDNKTYYHATFKVDGLLDHGSTNDNNRKYVSSKLRFYYNGDGFDKKIGALPLNNIDITPHVYKNKMFRFTNEDNTLGLFATEVISIEFRGFGGISASDFDKYYPVKLELIDERVIFSFAGHYSGTFGNYYIDEKSLSMFDSISSGILDDIPCLSVILEDPGKDHEGGTRFIASFDITDIKRNSSNNFWCHINFNGEPFDGNNGDLKPGAYSEDENWTYKTQIKTGGLTYSLFSCYGMPVFDIQ